MIKLKLNQRFTLEFMVQQSSVKKIEELLKENRFVLVKWNRVPFDNWIKIEVDVNLRRAELLRQLLKNYNTI